MPDNDTWLERFGRAHASFRNPYIYWLASPLLLLGITGILWALPSPPQFYDISPLLNWGSAFLMAAAIYYFIVSLSLALALLPLLIVLAIFQTWLSASMFPALSVTAGLLAAGLAGIVIGRAGRAADIFEDLQLLMLAPAWLLSRLYRRLNIPI